MSSTPTALLIGIIPCNADGLAVHAHQQQTAQNLPASDALRPAHAGARPCPPEVQICQTPGPESPADTSAVCRPQVPESPAWRSIWYRRAESWATSSILGAHQLHGRSAAAVHHMHPRSCHQTGPSTTLKKCRLWSRGPHSATIGKPCAALQTS